MPVWNNFNTSGLSTGLWFRVLSGGRGGGGGRGRRRRRREEGEKEAEEREEDSPESNVHEHVMKTSTFNWIT